MARPLDLPEPEAAGTRHPALEVVLPDREGTRPDEAGCGGYAQPLRA